MNMIKRERPAPKDLWDAFDSLRGEMDQALSLVRLPDVSGLFDRSAAPAMDVLETDEGFLVYADVPGLPKEDLELSVTGSLLTIKGDKKTGVEGGKNKSFRQETWTGSFSRTIDLPGQIDPEKVEAELKDGVLILRIAKREEAKTKQITVSVK